MACILLLLATGAVKANDFSFGGAGASFVPRQESRIRMVSEDIVAASHGGVWRVEAKYVFENPTAAPISLRMGYPEPRCPGDSDCDIELPFDDMRTWVDGKMVNLRRGGAWLGDSFPGLGNVWTYEASFGPKQRVEIRHEYTMNSSSNAYGDLSFGYVVRTGALWNGPIEHARFRFLVPPELRVMKPPKVGKPSEPRWTVVDGRVWTEVTVELENWTPTEDLWFTYNDQLNSGDWKLSLGKAHPDIVKRCVVDEYDALDALEAGTAQARDALTAKWASHGVDQLRACRQRLIASYGARFRSAALNQFFYGPEGFVDRGPPYLAFAPRSTFAVGMMSAEDQLIHEALLRAERVAPKVALTPVERFDVTTTPTVTEARVGDVVRFTLSPDYAEGACALSLYGRVRFVQGTQVFGRASTAWRPGQAPVGVEAVVAPTELDSWFGDPAWLRLGVTRRGTDLGGEGHHTKLPLPVRPRPYQVIAEPEVQTSPAPGPKPRLSLRREGTRVVVTFWIGAPGASRYATADVHALVVRSGRTEIVYLEASAKLGDTGEDAPNGVEAELSYPSDGTLPVDVVLVSKTDQYMPEPFVIDRAHLDAATSP